MHMWFGTNGILRDRRLGRYGRRFAVAAAKGEHREQGEAEKGDRRSPPVE
jgi:hypothetical protein